MNDYKINSEATDGKVKSDSSMSRRKLLAAMGLTGAAVATGAFMPGLNGQASANPNRDADQNIYQLLDHLPERSVADKLRESISVKDFGAKGDGVTDDTSAIQEGIYYLGDQGGGTLFFPAGTYIVSPHLNDRIQLKSNVSLIGTGRSSIIKIKDLTGDYFTLFGQLNDDPQEVLENIIIRDLRIDQNPTGNTNCDIGGQVLRRQHVFSFYNFENVAIENVEFNPTTSMNTITMNKRTAKIAIVRDCIFNFVRGNSSNPNYDNSAIYFQCFQHMAIGNQFNTEVGHGIGAMETHTGIAVIANNITRGYLVGLHIQPADYREPNMNIVGNTFVDAGRGIMIWGSTDVPVRNVNISSNVIKINNKSRQNISPIGGITMASNNHSSNLENVVISNNSILFEEETEDRGSEINITYVGGISLHRPTSYQNIVISNNTISKSPGFGISIGSFSPTEVSATNMVIQGNTIIDAGHYVAGPSSRKHFIEVRSLLKNVIIKDNVIMDQYPETRATMAIRALALWEGSANVKVLDNLVHANGNLANQLHHSVQIYPDHLELVSPNNRRFKLTIDDAGNLSAERI